MNTPRTTMRYTERGYTLLFSVLVSSVVLAIGISILNISKKEFLLASSARESTSAFYAADSGLECAMYWNQSEAGIEPAQMGVTVANIDCGLSSGIPITYFESGDGPPTAINGFVAAADFHVNFDNTGCSIVTVEKYRETLIVAGVPRDTDRTRITSRGYNIGWNSGSQTCSNASPRRVERALRFTL